MNKQRFFLGFLVLTLTLSLIPFVPPKPFVKADSGSWYGADAYDDDYENPDGVLHPTLGVVRCYSDNSAPYSLGHAGWHFDSVTIPQGSTVTSAKLTLLTTNAAYDDYNFRIYGHDIDDSGDFSDPADIDDRARTTANHYYTANGVGIGWKDYNITDCVIEIIEREGWQSGNGITFMFIANQDNNDRCDWDNWDHAPSERGELHISWTPPPPSPTYDSLDAEPSIFYDEYVFLNATVSIPGDHVTDLVNVTIGLNDGIILKYDNDTDTFSEYADPSSYVVLNVTACERTSLNSTQVKLSFNVKFVSPCPPELKDASSSTSKVFQVDGDLYASRSYIDWFYLWVTGNVLGVENTPFAWGWENSSSTESILNQSSETSTNLIAKYDNATLTTRGEDYGSTVTNYATLYVVDYGFVWGWSSTIYDVYRNQSYECIGESGYQDWLYNGLIAPPLFSPSFPTETGIPWYVPIVGYLVAVLLPFMIIAYYWSKARDWKTGLIVLLVCLLCYILFMVLWNLSDALVYWMYQ